MSSPDSGELEQEAPQDVSAGPREPRTDPGRARPFESLYRDSAGARTGAHRATARHFEPWLTPPEDAPESEDTFHWLYRKDTPPEQPDTHPPPVARRSTEQREEPEKPGSPTLTPTPRPPAVTPRHHRRTALVVVLVVLVLAAVGSAIALQSRQDSSGPAGPTSMVQPPASAGPSKKSAQPRSSEASRPPRSAGAYIGAVVPIRAQEAAADCSAPPSTDDAGKVVGYGPAQLIDTDPGTAWRCNGSGVGQRIVFFFPNSRRIAELGLINGYSKVDPSSGVRRYGQYRRVREVTWTFPGGATFTERLADRLEATQKLRIPVQTADRVTLTITKTTKPGLRSGSRDAAVISEASFAAPRG